MTSRVEHNKREKERSLYQAAYELFTKKGINETTINNIVKEAGVAKGTFYLYFKDKYDILDKIILDKSSEILDAAINSTKTKDFEDFYGELIYFVDYIIEYLKENKLLLKLIHKNLSWGIFKRASKDYKEINSIYNMFERGYEGENISQEEIKRRLFMVIELTSAVSYSAIIHKEPEDIDIMKESLFETICKIV